MSILVKGFRPLVVGLCLISFVPSRAEPPVDTKKAEVKKAVPTKFLRVQRDDKKQMTALETAVVRYVPASGEGDVTVDLIGAVHVGDKAYYEKLNKLMEQYDVLLYELVAPQGTRVPKGGNRNNDNPLAMIQKTIKVMLDLEFQLEQIDYTKKNFVHADLSPQEMAEVIRKRGDDAFTLTLSVMADLLRQQNLEKMKEKMQGKGEDIDLAALLLDPQRAVKLKRFMADQFEAMDNPESSFGKTISTILIEDRNKAALKVLTQQLTKGKKKIGIFYGAAHMTDFEKRLRDDFDLKKQKEEWLTAWDLKAGKKKSGIEDLLKLLDD
jgi:hypothetical protein